MAEQLGIYEFSRQLVSTKDLDPVYVVLWQAGFDREILQRWLLAYWCFYHCGTASWIVDQPNYWQAMRAAAATKEHPRSSERRHFRGATAINSVEYLAKQDVRNLFHPFSCKPTIPAKEVMGYIKTWYGFGEWISFKVADMLERLNIAKISFDIDTIQLFDSPRKGAQDMWERYGEVGTTSGTIDPVPWAIRKLTKHLGVRLAPPRYERPLNVQEIETCLCKYHSHLSGHYEVGKDIKEVHHGLTRYENCRTAQRLLEAGKSGGLW